MANNGISINILANVRDALKGTGDVEAALSDVEATLEDMSREGKSSTERMERGFRDLAREADDTADTLKSKFRAAYRDVGDASRDAGKDVEKFGSTARAEFGDSAREGAASWNGEISDIGDVLQETAANLGPAGLIGAGLIGAVGAVATAAVEEWQEKIQGINEATAGMWQKAASEGQAFIDGEAIRAEAQRIIWDDAYEENMRAAEGAGVSRSEFALALAQGEGEAFDRVHKQIMDARAKEQAAASAALQASTDGNVALQDATAVVNSELARTVSILDEKAAATEKNKTRATEAADAEKLQNEQTRDQIDRTAAAAQARYEGLAEQYANPLQLKVGVDDNAVTVAQNRLNQLRRDAERGVTINMRNVNGRQLLP